MGDGEGVRDGGQLERRAGKPPVVTASFLPDFRNEIRESGSIYGNVGSRPSRSCPLEGFKWFLRNLFPRRDDSEKFTQQSLLRATLWLQGVAPCLMLPQRKV